MQEFLKLMPTWTRKPAEVMINENQVEIITESDTDLWARTYYGIKTDSAPLLQVKTDEKFFSFIVKTEFKSNHRFDQCGIVMYLDDDNWFKSSIEYENKEIQRLGSVVTNLGYSDWATIDISSEVNIMWYRFSRREDDYLIEYSYDGKSFKQMRIFHMWKGHNEINFGIYAASPTNGSFKAVFSNMFITECVWKRDNEHIIK